MKPVVFFVAGLPAPQGSKTAIKRGNRAYVIEGGSDSGRIKHRAWRDVVAAGARAAVQAHRHGVPMDGPLSVVVDFHFERPKSVRSGTVHKATRPDLDKLARSTLDSLTTGGLIEDDARVAALYLTKTYVDPGEQPGARIAVQEFGDDSSDPVR